MRKTIFGFIFIVISSMCLGGAEGKTIVFATDHSPPYTIAPGDESRQEGFMVDVARYAFENAGYEVRVYFAPYMRSIQDVRAGYANAVLLVAEATAPGLIFLKHPISREKVAFFVKKGSRWRYAGIQSLDNMRIGSGLGYDFADPDVNEYIRRKSAENPELIQLLSGDDVNLKNFRKLLLDRIDIVIATEYIGTYVARQNNLLAQIEIAGRSTAQIVAQTGFNPKDANSRIYADILSQCVLELNASGKMNEIKAKYGLGN
jgi:polar amino acid transport system substrate-binding protein